MSPSTNNSLKEWTEKERKREKNQERKREFLNTIMNNKWERNWFMISPNYTSIKQQEEIFSTMQLTRHKQTNKQTIILFSFLILSVFWFAFPPKTNLALIFARVFLICVFFCVFCTFCPRGGVHPIGGNNDVYFSSLPPIAKSGWIVKYLLLPHHTLTHSFIINLFHNNNNNNNNIMIVSKHLVFPRRHSTS